MTRKSHVTQNAKKIAIYLKEKKLVCLSLSTLNIFACLTNISNCLLLEGTELRGKLSDGARQHGRLLNVTLRRPSMCFDTSKSPLAPASL